MRLLLFVVALVGAAAIYNSCQAQNDTSYMVRYDETGKDYWFRLVGDDTAAIDTPPLFLQDSSEEAEQLPALPADGFTGNDTPIKLPTGDPSLEWLFNPENGVLSGLLMLIMYLSSYIPGLKKLDNKRLRALAVGILLIGGVVIWRVFEQDLTAANFLGTIRS